MLKGFARMIEGKKPEYKNHDDAGVERMTRMRARITLNNLKALKVDEEGKVVEPESPKDLLSKAKNLEVGDSTRGYTFRGRDERARRMGALVKDWQDRMAHLPGFEIDPAYK